MLRDRFVAAGLFDVLVDAARAHYVSVDDVLGRARTPHAVAARRQVAVALRGDPYRRSYSEIGKLLGRDHTSIMNLTGSKHRSPIDKT